MSYRIIPMSDELIAALDTKVESTIITAVSLDIVWADDELALSDFVYDLEQIIELSEVTSVSESTPPLLRQLLAAINTAWTAAGASREGIPE